METNQIPPQKRKILRNVLRIYFSLVVFLLLTGCATFRGDGEKWIIPSKPEMKPVEVVPIKEVQIEYDGFYLTREHATNLVDNVDELKAYIEKLKMLIKKMEEYYGLR